MTTAFSQAQTTITLSATQDNTIYGEATKNKEINNTFFEVEHSTDTSNLSSIARVAGAGNSSQELNYSFIHDNAMPGKNFYRLRQSRFWRSQHF